MIRQLSELSTGDRGRVVRLGGGDDAVSRRFLEMGVLEGENFEVLHEAPFGADPIAVWIRGALIGMRRDEARSVWVELAPSRGDA